MKRNPTSYCIILTSVISVLLYLSFAFITAELNPFHWNTGVRFLLVAFVSVNWIYCFSLWLNATNYRSRY